MCACSRHAPICGALVRSMLKSCWHNSCMELNLAEPNRPALHATPALISLLPFRVS